MNPNLIPVQVNIQGTVNYWVMWFSRVPNIGERIDVRRTNQAMFDNTLTDVYKVVDVEHVPLHASQEGIDIDDESLQWLSKPDFSHPISFLAAIWVTKEGT